MMALVLKHIDIAKLPSLALSDRKQLPNNEFQTA